MGRCVAGIADASLRSTCLSEDLQGRGSEDLESLQDRKEKANLG